MNKYIHLINKYNKEKMKLYSFRFHKENQADIIEHLDKQENKAGYIARLIREDMERNGIPTKKKITIADIMDEIKDNDDVMLVYPDKSSLMTTKEGLKDFLNREVAHYHFEGINNKLVVIEVRYA